MRCSNSTLYAVTRFAYDGLACCKTLDGPKGDGSLELPDTRFAARTGPEDRAIAPTTLKNKARPASANQAARLRRGRRCCPRRQQADQSCPGRRPTHSCVIAQP